MRASAATRFSVYTFPFDETSNFAFKDLKSVHKTNLYLEARGKIVFEYKKTFADDFIFLAKLFLSLWRNWDKKKKNTISRNFEIFS